MFDNVPDWLTEKVRHFGQTIDQETRSDRAFVYVHAAGWVIACYLRMDVTAPGANEFLETKPLGEPGGIPANTINRVLLIAESIFLLRSCRGFPEFCRRMRVGNLRAHFFELLWAKRFFKAGYEINARPETGVKGDDFDFTATRDDEVVNVEVTSLTAPVPSDSTVRNALQAKRKQVPDTAAAIIVCIIPETWLATPTLGSILKDAATTFLSRTRRINFVVFATERRVERQDGTQALILWHDTITKALFR